MDPVPDLADLISIFEGEPRYVYEDDERAAGYEMDWREMWPYTRVVFTLTRGDRDISLDLEPGYEQMRLTVSDAHGEVVDLLLRQVQSISVDIAKGREVLKIGLREGRNVAPIFVQVKPVISVGWEPFPAH